jgi:hypothetical protein
MPVCDSHEIDRDIRVWLDPGGGIALKAVTAEGDPVELSPAQARKMAAVLVELADIDDRG